MPEATLVVDSVKVAVDPSFTDAAEAVRVYVGTRGEVEESTTVVEADCPSTVTVSVSLPSVKVSATRGTEMVA